MGSAKVQLRALLEKLQENGDIQLNQAPESCSAWEHVEAPNAGQLRQRLRELEETHETLMRAAREEIASLRTSLQQAHADLADARAEKRLARPVQAQRLNAVKAPQLIERWIGTACLRNVFQLWHKEARLERLERWQEDQRAELEQRNEELQQWRSKFDQDAGIPNRAGVVPPRAPLVPLALLTSWRESSQTQTMSYYLRLWREQVAEVVRHRQAFELFELKAQVQEGQLARSSALDWRHRKVVDSSISFRLRMTGRHRLRLTLLNWRFVAHVLGTRRHDFLQHRWRLATRVFNAWRVIGLRGMAELRRRGRQGLSQLHAVAGLVRDRHQRTVKMAAFEAWLRALRISGPKMGLRQRRPGLDPF